ncbi:MAG: sigma 54-interacting transcriptional regulator [Desulfomonile tiedjei]|uniref:Sigma 54-interacting transcriptional regulator n=1 Tax=Desulfomonile tiedjei TaxID=2358 RepID=A0A9D6V3N0_9BACT|nr:sigma 54-interacting transcriptional regulator [Desulfomonile tiedjei]
MSPYLQEIAFSELPEDPFRDLSESLRESIRQKSTLKDYQPDSVLVQAGDRGETIRFLISGRASVVIKEEVGQDIPVEIVYPGDLVGEISYLIGRPAPMNSEVVALETCRVLEIPALEFEKILQSEPAAAVTVLKSLARKVVRLDGSVYKYVRKKRALQTLISRQEHLFPDYFVSETVRRRTGKQLEELARSGEPILITGETGVGKEFMAHAIYGASNHHKRIFLCLDLLSPFAPSESTANYCELPESPADRTKEQMRLFFGSESDAEGDHKLETPGYFELTEEGTLVVRSIEQLTPKVQDELLKTLQTGTFRRLSGATDQVADFRLIGTTNLDASEISEEKHPLLHWLLRNCLDIPPLRKRRKEIPALARHYVNQYCQELHKDFRKLPKETVKALVTYSWPGNDRELATTLKRAVLLAENGILRPQDVYFDLRRIEGQGRIDLLRMPALRSAMKSPLFPAIFQSAATPFFFILLIMLFLGPADPESNLGGLFSWAIGWPTMVFGAFLWARFWCSVCPMGAISNLAKRIISWELPFPAFLKLHSDLIVAASALFIIWLETATDIRNSPFNTGLLLLSILGLAILVSVIFERQSWCRYLCPLGGMMGVFAKVSPIELRADRNVCASQCTSNECFIGTDKREGCPFGQMVPSLRSNRFCKLCGACYKNCPHSAITLNLRVPGREIWEIRQAFAVTAFLVISMLGGLLSELLHKSAIYEKLGILLPNVPELIRFTIFFIGILASANLLVLLSAAVSARASGDDTKENFARYGLALLPLVLVGYMAFHLYYLINLGVHFPLVLWQMFQFEVFRQLVITVPPAWTLFFQETLIWIGVVGTLVVGYRLSRGRQTNLRDSLGEFLPHAIVALGFGVSLLRAIKDFFY